jgi:hypothetical protein
MPHGGFGKRSPGPWLRDRLFVMRDPSTYPCPCCGDLVFDEEPGSYDILLIQCQQECASSRKRDAVYYWRSQR